MADWFQAAEVARETFEAQERRRAELAEQEKSEIVLPPGGRTYTLFASFMDEDAMRHAPWIEDNRWRIRDTATAALHTAKVWGPGAIAGTCVQIWWPDGREYRTPWERIVEIEATGSQ